MFDTSGKTLILFNGPPGSGKDEAARLVNQCSERAVYATKFSGAMKANVMAALGLIPTVEGVPVTNRQAILDAFDQIKDRQLPEFGGRTGREIVIAYSETFAKPIFGKDFFGQLTAREVLDHFGKEDFLDDPVDEIVTISDSGFAEEGLALVTARTVTDQPLFDRIILVRLHREGCDFSNDSRSYWSLYDHGFSTFEVEEYDVQNNGTIDDLRNELARIMPDLLEVPAMTLEVQLPAGNVGEPVWVAFRSNIRHLEQALASVETARRSTYKDRVIRIVRNGTVNANAQILKVIYPGDAPVYAFENGPKAPVQEVTP